MSQTTTVAATTTARLSAEGDKIVLVGPYDLELVEFYRSLPRAKFVVPCPACGKKRTKRLRSVTAFSGKTTTWHGCADCEHEFPSYRSPSYWTCDATPGAAWRIREREDIDDSGQLCELANSLTGEVEMLNPECANDQPLIRHTEAWRHQIKAYRFSLYRQATMLGMQMGTGKTKPTIDLIWNWHCGNVLVLVPARDVCDVWESELAKHAPGYYLLVRLDFGNSKKSVAEAKKWWVGANRQEGPLIYMINYESARTKTFADWSLSQDWDLVVLDESHRAKAPNGVTAKYVEKLACVAKRRLCLTGTPMPHSPMDAFSQCRFLDPGLFGSYISHFRNRYCVMGGHVSQEDWEDEPSAKNITGYKNQDEFTRLLGLVMFQCGDEVLDLPPTQDHYRRFDLSPTARRHYDELERDLITEIESGVVTAANALVKLLRLQQVTSGYLRIQGEKIVRDDIVPFDEDAQIDTGKAELLAELLEDMGPREKVVVFCRFKYDVQSVKQIAEALDRPYLEMSGRIPYQQRCDNLRTFRESDKAEVFGIQVQSGKEGLNDLVAARYCILYSTGFLSPGDMNQVRKRIHRPGQERPVHYYHLLARGTVDETVIAVRKKRADVVQGVLDALKGGDQTEDA